MTPDRSSSKRQARGIGIATLGIDDARDKVLDTWYPIMAVGDEADPSGAVLAAAGESDVPGIRQVDPEALREGAKGTEHEDLLGNLAASLADQNRGTGLPVHRIAVVTIIDLDAPPLNAHDVYLRLHLLSSRRAVPNSINLDGIFGILANVVWTSRGPADPDGFEAARAALLARGERIDVTGIDKFPRMTDYVIPTGVRIANVDRVRLGAHLADGTTVMHEGFVNFNAGTLGPSMVEGRISQGVVVDSDSDIGGGSSIMGTLSGGGKEVIRIGKGCLLGANAGLGISLGDGCVVEAGLYVTAGTIVTTPDGEVVKARELSGRDGLLFIRNSTSGVVEVRARRGSWGDLNTALHAN